MTFPTGWSSKEVLTSYLYLINFQFPWEAMQVARTWTGRVTCCLYECAP